MTNRATPRIDLARRALLAAAGTLAIIGPLAIGLMEAPPLRAQAKVSAQYSFETISVKLVSKVDGHYFLPHFQPGGRFVSSASIAAVIAQAYNVPFQTPRLTGGPDWVRSEVYEIEATSPKDMFPESLTQTERDDRSRAMLRSLLAERFKLAARLDPRELPVYVLTVAKGGPKLEKADADEKDCVAPPPAGQQPCHELNGGRGRGMHGRAVTIADTVKFAENWTDKPFLDKTGLTGLYKVDTGGWLPMQWALSPPPVGTLLDGQDAADLPSLFTIFERMGLKMEDRREKTDVVVIDHIERPTEN